VNPASARWYELSREQQTAEFKALSPGYLDHLEGVAENCDSHDRPGGHIALISKIRELRELISTSTRSEIGECCHCPGSRGGNNEHIGDACPAFNADGSVTYTPEALYVGPDEFIYTVR